MNNKIIIYYNKIDVSEGINVKQKLKNTNFENAFFEEGISRMHFMWERFSECIF